MSKVNLSKVFPIQEIGENFLINGDGSITFGFSVRYHGVFEQSSDDYGNLVIAIERIINSLPSNVVFHQQDIIYVEEYMRDPLGNQSRLSNEYYKHYYKRPLQRHYTNMYLTFVNTSIAKINNKSNSLLRMLDYTTLRPFKKIEEIYSSIENDAEQFNKSLRSIDDLTVISMDKSLLKKALAEYWSLEFDPLKTKVDDRLPEQAIQKGYFKIGSKYLEMVSMVGESKELASSHNYNIDLSINEEGIPLSKGINTHYSFGYPLTLGLPFNHVVNTFIHKLDSEDIEGIVKGGALGKQNLQLMGLLNEDAQTKARYIYGDKDIPSFFRHLSEHSMTSCRVGSNVIVYDENIDRLSRKVGDIKSAYAKMGDAWGMEENEDLANLFYLSSPGNSVNNYRSRFITTTNLAVCYLPKESQMFSHKDGLLFTSRNGEPIKFDIENGYGLNAKNAVLFGPTGTGKSVLINNIVDQSIDSGIITIIIDAGGSFKKLILARKGLYYDTGLKKNLSFNPFTDCERDVLGNWLYNATDEDQEGGEDQINYVYSVLSSVSKGDLKISKAAKEIYKDTIVKYYEMVNSEKTYPLLNGWLDFIDIYRKTHSREGDEEIMNFNELKRSFTSFYKGGIYEHVLNSKNNIDISKENLVAFDLEPIKDKEDIREIVITIIIRNATRIIEKRKGELKSLIIDEAIDFLTGDSGEFIAAQYRKIRKRGGRVFLSTQGISYLNGLDELTINSILGNSPIRFILSHQDNTSDYPLLKEKLSLTDDDLDLLKTVDRDCYEVFVKILNYATIVRNEITPYQLAHYTTDTRHLDIIDNYFKKYGHLGMAIEEFINKHLKKNEDA